MKAPRIVAIGDNCLDVYTTLHRAYPGGGALNFAVHAAREGASASYIGAVGTNAYGEHLRAALAAEGVDTSAMQTIPGPTAVAYVRLDGGDRVFVGSDRGVREQLRLDAAVEQHLAGADLIHTTLDGRVDGEMPRWKSRGHATSFDFSHRYRPEQLDLLPHLDLAFFSGQAMGAEHAEEAARTFQARGARVVVVTLGHLGSLAFDGTSVVRQAADAITPLDTLGAGDGFMAAFAVAYLRHGNLAEALAAGTRVATTICDHYGAFGHGIVAQPFVSPETRGPVSGTGTSEASVTCGT